MSGLCRAIRCAVVKGSHTYVLVSYFGAALLQASRTVSIRRIAFVKCFCIQCKSVPIVLFCVIVQHHEDSRTKNMIMAKESNCGATASCLDDGDITKRAAHLASAHFLSFAKLRTDDLLGLPHWVAEGLVGYWGCWSTLAYATWIGFNVLSRHARCRLGCILSLTLGTKNACGSHVNLFGGEACLASIFYFLYICGCFVSKKGSWHTMKKCSQGFVCGIVEHREGTRNKKVITTDEPNYRATAYCLNEE